MSVNPGAAEDVDERDSALERDGNADDGRAPHRSRAQTNTTTQTRLLSAVVVGALIGTAASVGAALIMSAIGPAEIRALDATWDAVRLLIALGAGVAASIVDVREHRLPNIITLPGATAVVASAVVQSIWTGSPEVLALAIAGALVAGVTLFVLAWFGTLGLGDVKLGVALGAALLPAFGWSTLGVTFVLTYVLACPQAVALLIARRRRRSNASELAFGPYLVAGALAATIIALAAGTGTGIDSGTSIDSGTTAVSASPLLPLSRQADYPG